MIPTGPVLLEDAVVRLEPLTHDHAEALLVASSVGSETYRLTRVPSTLEVMHAYIDWALDEARRGLSVPFATRDAKSGQIVGSTRFMTIERWTWLVPSRFQRGAEYADVTEIGGTWLTPSAQRTGINTHAKLLMLTHAFEAWEVLRVSLKTDARNSRSRTAIQRLGARFDGVVRAHQPAADGEVRDTAFFSILREEWPEVKARLTEMAMR